MLRVKMYPAQNGDAFLIHADEANILIDGGYAITFDDHIQHDLKKLAANGEVLNLIITTHIDSDHIGGIIRFLSKNGLSDQPKIISVHNIWHNSLRSLTSPCDSKIQAKNLELLEAINLRGHPPQSSNKDSTLEEISAKQGSALASIIRRGGYLWNGRDGTASISVENSNALSLSKKSIRVITPSKKRLDGLLKSWKRQLHSYGYKGPMGAGDIIDDAFEFSFEHLPENPEEEPKQLSSRRGKKLKDVYQPDTSITNSSSIAAIIELGGARILMLADAWAEDVVESLRKQQAMGCSMIFDAIKISHHGSFRNTSPELLQLVDAPMYFISSNGRKHNHPDIELLTAIVERPANFSRTLYFNYPTPASSEIQTCETKNGAPFLARENATEWVLVKDD